jgi:hypothetical protein
MADDDSGMVGKASAAIQTANERAEKTRKDFGRILVQHDRRATQPAARSRLRLHTQLVARATQPTARSRLRAVGSVLGAPSALPLTRLPALPFSEYWLNSSLWGVAFDLCNCFLSLLSVCMYVIQVCPVSATRLRDN